MTKALLGGIGALVGKMLQTQTVGIFPCHTDSESTMLGVTKPTVLMFSLGMSPYQPCLMNLVDFKMSKYASVSAIMAYVRWQVC